MALEVSKLTEYGVNASYWRVVGVTIDVLRGMVVISVAAYVDDAGRLANRVALASLQANCTPVQFEAEVARAGGALAACYNLLKTLPDFTGAKDV